LRKKEKRKKKKEKGGGLRFKIFLNSYIKFSKLKTGGIISKWRKPQGS
jgi:hypothetical protein